MATITVLLQDDILCSKSAIFSALQTQFSTEMAGLTLADLEWYGIVDPSFARFEFKQVDLGTGKLQRRILLFEAGLIMQLLQTLDYGLFGDKTYDQLVSYSDYELDSNLVKFTFKEKKV